MNHTFPKVGTQEKVSTFQGLFDCFLVFFWFWFGLVCCSIKKRRKEKLGQAFIELLKSCLGCPDPTSECLILTLPSNPYFYQT